MNSKIKKVFFVLSIIMTFPLFAGQLQSEWDVSVIETKYFDIIYPKQSAESAKILAENADSMYEEVAELLHTETNMHLPIVITPNTQELNAYFSPYPYNHIVLFDTPVNSSSLAVFSKTFLSVFYHELVHAVSLNIRSPAWNFLAKIFGDVFSPSMFLTMPLSFKEGVTVSFESLKGEGRINGGLSMSYLVQAKIENVFPTWKEAAGVRDIFPVGAYPYLFGGAFSSFIQEKYGMEKYAELWNISGTGNYFFTSSLFKKVYKNSLKDEWKAFEDSIPLPSNLIDESLIKKLKQNGNYSFLTSNSEGDIVYNSAWDNGVYFINAEDFNTVNTSEEKIDVKAKKLFSIDNSVNSLSFSKKNKLLAVSCLKASNTSLYITKFFDLEKKSFKNNVINNLRNAEFITINNRQYIIGIETHESNSFIAIYDFEESIQKKNCSPKIKYQMQMFNEPYDFVQTEENSVIILYKDNGVWTLSSVLFAQDAFTNNNNIVSDFNKVIESSFVFPIDIAAVNITNSLQKNKLLTTVSYKGLKAGDDNTLGSLPRIGIVELPKDNNSNLSEVVFSISNEDVSGGFRYPVEFDDSYLFVSQKAYNFNIEAVSKNYISFTEIDKNTYENKDLLVNSFIQKDYSINLENESQSKYKENKYNPFKYLSDGLLLPTPYMSLDFDENPRYINPYIMGLSFISSDPAENLTFSVGIGTDFFSLFGKTNPSEDFTMNAALKGGNDNLSFMLFSSMNCKLPKITEIYSSIYLTGSLPFINFLQYFSWENIIDYTYLPQNDSHLFQDGLKIQYSYYQQKGQGFYSESGITLGLSCYANLFTTNAEFSDYLWTVNPGIYTSVQLAKLLPFNNPYGYTLNLPLTLSGSLISNSNSFLDLQAETILFSKEIQKEISFMPLYINRFVITGGYTADWDYELQSLSILKLPKLFKTIDAMMLKHGITFGASLKLTPVIGVLTSIQLDFGAKFTYYFENKQNEKPYEVNICGVFTF